MLRRLFWRAGALLALFALGTFAMAQEPLLDLSAGNLHFTLSDKRGVQLTARGVSVIRESHLYLVDPGWTKALVNSESLTPTVTTSTEGDAQVGTATFTTKDGSAAYRFEVRPDDTFVTKVTYEANEPAAVEAAAYLNANLITGAPYTAETVDGPRQGSVAPSSTETDQVKARLTPRLSRIAFQTPIGPLTITVEGDNPNNRSATLFDARGLTTEWAVRHPVFWFGLGSPVPPVAPGKNTLTITYAFGPQPKHARVPVATASAKTAALPDATVPAGPDLPVIPQPKEMTDGGGPLYLTSGVRILIPDDATEEEKIAAREVQAELGHFWHVTAKIVRASAARGAKAGEIVLCRAGAGLASAADEARVPDQTEGYSVRVDTKRAVIVGHDPRGVYDGAQTLKQLLRVDRRGVYVKSAAIRDWPTLTWRGVHWFGGPHPLPFHERMIDRIAAPLKYNNMVYELEYTQWDSQPKIWDPTRSTPKKDVIAAVKDARNHLIEPIPMVPSLGHMDWLFKNGQNMDIVADPEHPYAYDPDNPRSYDVIFGIFQEAIDMFHPKTFHIGHDEVELVGTFPPKGRTKTTTDYIIEDTNRLYNWLKAKNLNVMMWGDMLLHPTEGSGGAAFAPTKEDAAKRRAGIPKDILIADWHYNYSAEPEYPSVEVLQKDGFQVLGSSWFGWGNIQGFAKVLNEQKSLGLLQTTWAGYDMNLGLLDTQELGQFIAYLVAAEAAWNGGAHDPKTADYSPEDAFLTFWNRQPIATHDRPGFTVDLSALANTDMWGWASSGLTAEDAEGTKVSRRTSDFPSSAKPPRSSASSAVNPPTYLAGTAFEIGRPVLLDGPLNPAGTWPGALKVPLGNRTAKELHWLWGSTYPVAIGTEVARVTVTYADGTTAQAPVRYGKETFAFTDLRARKWTTVAWRGHAPDGERADIRRWVWTNPHPEKPIASVTLTSAGTEAAPVLLAVTGVN